MSLTFLRRLLPGLLALAVTVPAQAGRYNLDAVERHGDWHSLRLTLGEERHVRALEQRSYSDTVFSVNASPGACDRPWLEMRVELGEVQAESATVNLVPADLLVDDGRVHTGQAAFITERGNSGFYARFTLPDTGALLAEMGAGEVLRLRLHRAEQDYWFLVFRLEGAEAALTRMRRLCEGRAD
ncbi:hypothetical protein [Halomonas sp. M4R1S46]|uniref:hypothetical protein n=1 Tax=Halomonas sp. M4R1S46 TaxID=2982692 RepID=UPI0021E3D410|nr:hypothetical protein [Halomonas sp. M4R1S46]UYG07689.1 hypothetical protein OCT48_19005 [Halomonas sp. M4R1S46]